MFLLFLLAASLAWPFTSTIPAFPCSWLQGSHHFLIMSCSAHHSCSYATTSTAAEARGSEAGHCQLVSKGLSRAGRGGANKNSCKSCGCSAVPEERRSLLRAEFKSWWRMYTLCWALDKRVGPWHLHQLLTARPGSLSSAVLPYFGPYCSRLSTGQCAPPLPAISSNSFGKARQTPPPETSSQQCYFKDKLKRHSKAF